MPFFAEITPVVTGTSGRAIAFWTELVTFSLILLSGVSILSLIGFGLLFFLAILDLTIAIRRSKHHRAASYAGREYVSKPKIWLIVVDMIFALCFTGVWVLFMVFSWSSFAVSIVRYNRAIFHGFSMIGCLTIAHLHWIFGAVECHLLRQMRDSNTVATKAYQEEVCKDDMSIELGPTKTYQGEVRKKHMSAELGPTTTYQGEVRKEHMSAELGPSGKY